MEYHEVENIVYQIKKAIQNALKKQQYEIALNLVSLCADVLYFTNLYYMDTDLELILQQIAHAVIPYEACKNIASASNSDTVLFYDGFGLDNRGLAQIYLKAICKKRTLCYVTYKNRSNEIPEILNIVLSHGGSVFFLQEGKKLDQIDQLNSILKKANSSHFILYAYPNDVVATTLLYRYEGLLKRYQVNLTDHAFWLGAQCMDVCIEFREYGASISREYRSIPENRIVLLPFYPNINEKQPFLGFPFNVTADTKVVFSGGSLYKTLGNGNKYYEIVDYLLSKYPQVVFWYAGTGDDTIMRKLIEKYPGQLYLTPERKDLFQLLKHCYFYLSTYPICGGLMYQYAACAGKVPLTLRNGDTNDGFLLNQYALGIEFDTVQDLLKEIDRFMEDESYVLRKNAEMLNCVISPERFQNELIRILELNVSTFQINYLHINSDEFKQLYLENTNLQKLNELFVRKNSIETMLHYFPERFLLGAWSKIRQKIQNKFFSR